MIWSYIVLRNADLNAITRMGFILKYVIEAVFLICHPALLKTSCRGLLSFCASLLKSFRHV